MWLLKVLKLLKICLTIKSFFIYSCVLIHVFLKGAQADIILPSPEEKHENSAPTPELARLNGYRCDIHTVITEDGYLLQVHRLPGGRASPVNCSLPPVLLMHGIVQSSVCWLTPGPAQGLGYLLADLGYDVWLGNIRGNVYCKNNVRFNVDQDAFWDFSWETAGLFDLSATIDYILNRTGYEQLLYLGYSQGTSEFFVLCTLRPEYNNKVQHMVALAPIAYLTYSPSFTQLVAPIDDPLALLLSLPGHGEILPRNSVFSNFLQYACAIRANAVFCEELLFLIFGFDPIGFNQTLIPTLFGHAPAGTSVKTLVHYAQVINSKRFQRFDFGPEKNLEVYNSTTPPQFNLSKISVPLSFFYGDNDLLADPKVISSEAENKIPYWNKIIPEVSYRHRTCKDVMDLVSQLKVQVDVYRVNLTSFNHIDFIYSKNLNELVYNKVISIFATKQTLSNKTKCGP